MDKKRDTDVVLLVTADKQRNGTQIRIGYSAIFAKEDAGLDSVEANVLEMVQETLDCWSCGCVTGYPVSWFSEEDCNALKQYGLNQRFER